MFLFRSIPEIKRKNNSLTRKALEVFYFFIKSILSKVVRILKLSNFFSYRVHSFCVSIFLYILLLNKSEKVQSNFWIIIAPSIGRTELLRILDILRKLHIL